MCFSSSLSEKWWFSKRYCMFKAAWGDLCRGSSGSHLCLWKDCGPCPCPCDCFYVFLFICLLSWWFIVVCWDFIWILFYFIIYFDPWASFWPSLWQVLYSKPLFWGTDRSPAHSWVGLTVFLHHLHANTPHLRVIDARPGVKRKHRFSTEMKRLAEEKLLSFGLIFSEHLFHKVLTAPNCWTLTVNSCWNQETCVQNKSYSLNWRHVTMDNMNT